jgi:hypothetical protein
MQLAGWMLQRRLGSGAAALAVAWAAAPGEAQAASPSILATPLDSAVCLFSSMTLTTNLAVHAAPGVSDLGGTPVYLDASGTCTSALGSSALTIHASGTTLGPATCGAISSANVLGNITVGTTVYSALIAFSGPTAGTALLITPANPSVQLGVGAGLLSVTVPSLQACLQPSGTTTLQYTGAAVIVF